MMMARKNVFCLTSVHQHEQLMSAGYFSPSCHMITDIQHLEDCPWKLLLTNKRIHGSDPQSSVTEITSVMPSLSNAVGGGTEHSEHLLNSPDRRRRATEPVGPVILKKMLAEQHQQMSPWPGVSLQQLLVMMPVAHSVGRHCVPAKRGQPGVHYVQLHR